MQKISCIKSMDPVWNGHGHAAVHQGSPQDIQRPGLFCPPDGEVGKLQPNDQG